MSLICSKHSSDCFCFSSLLSKGKFTLDVVLDSVLSANKILDVENSLVIPNFFFLHTGKISGLSLVNLLNIINFFRGFFIPVMCKAQSAVSTLDPL